MTPLIIPPMRAGRLYRDAAIALFLGCVPFAFFALGQYDWGGRISPGLAGAAGVALIGYGLFIAANTFLGYPLLRLEPGRLVLARTPLTQQTVDLEPLGRAYAVQSKDRGFKRTDLAFRLAADEAVRHAAGKPPSPPVRDEMADQVNVNALVGNDLAMAEAIAAKINAQRGLG